MHDIERARAAVSQVLHIEDVVAENGLPNAALSRYDRIFNAAVAIYCAMLTAEATDRPQVRYPST